MPEYDMSIHTNPDARVWAKFFIKTNPNSSVPEDVMVTWFANAMMAMHDHMCHASAPIVLPDGSAICVA